MAIFGLGKVSGIEPEFKTVQKPIQAVGLSTRTNMKNVFRDLPKLYRKYLADKEQYSIKTIKEPWEYISLSDNFADDKSWTYHTGYVVTDSTGAAPDFEGFAAPVGTYAVFPLRPKSKLLLGLAMGRLKRYIYGKWLPSSGYEFAGYEFEYNNERMWQESPVFIDLYVAVREKKA